VKEYQAVLTKYFVFEGRSSRREFWMFVLFNFLISFAVGFVAGLIRVPLLASIYPLVVMIPSLAVAVRRLHDLGKGGLWLLIGLIPLVGWIWLLVLYASKGQSGANQYGDPVE
jgi:uncharacterized membrane protein YhaH (DUF805 family)